MYHSPRVAVALRRQSIGESDVEAAIAASTYTDEGQLAFEEFHSMAINLKERAESNSDDNDGGWGVNTVESARSEVASSSDGNKTMQQFQPKAEEEGHNQASALYMNSLDGENKDEWKPAKVWWEDQQSVIMAAKMAALQVKISVWLLSYCARLKFEAWRFAFTQWLAG